ncbi:YvrJ family protein [Lederbergia citri]|uniref:YvrJ family protein n=1 Tax=Lederbergia citri TaxID=2833580 RepID=UPI002D7EE2B6|nr:YvrJ family protein [Lederbergia citri]
MSGSACFFYHILNERSGSKVEQILPFLSEVGFPALVTFYLLYRIETKLEAVLQSLQSLPERMRNGE